MRELRTLPLDRARPASRDGLSGVGMEQHATEDLIGPLNAVEKKHAPEILYTEGDVGLLARGPRVSVVGSRKPSDKGMKRADALTKALVGAGITVVSGGAMGIDAIAHRVAMAEGGRTIGVLGTGVDVRYPRSSAALQDAIARDYLLVSQFPPGAPGKRFHFPKRNRTMALLSDATIIVEAQEKSGTVHQGWEALRLGRLLFLLESLATRDDLSWTSKFIHYGAQILKQDTLAEALGAIPERPSGPVAF